MAVKSPYEHFPYITADEVTLRKTVPSDVDDLFELYSNENQFRHSPVMLRKTKEAVANMIGHFERDFLKKKLILLGICLNSESDRVVGTVELFDYAPEVNAITIGYRLQNRVWGQGIATKAVAAMLEYLIGDLEINRVQAFVMPENEKSQHVLLRNGFTLEGTIRQGHVWKGHGVVDLMLYSRLRSDV
ncbi:GNAT family protein [Gorillibacterium sp. CAU 1737]|uniref:GNAT family N-acetyltransferase n=1 Tax=Gorillibacterium sp. CAU 1737 TaxID=3140362 RepID=UPI003260B630